MKTALEEIYKKKKLLDTLKPFAKEFVKNLDEWFKIELTYTSNAIEGNTLSRAETALVVEKGITVEGKSVTEHLEAINHAKAWEYIITTKNDPVTERSILDIHSIILQTIDPSNAGRYRSVPVRIAGSTVILPNPLKVPDLMTEFTAWLTTTNDDLVDKAILAHFKLVSIHPFTDGNGRTARLLMNLLLLKNGFPPAIIRKEDRKAYINSIEHSQLTGDTNDYVALMYEAIERSLDVYLDMLKPHKEKLLKIGELARQTDESIATIRYWTKEKLLAVTSRSKGGYQLYHPTSVDRVKRIRALQREKRLTIKELQQQLPTLLPTK